MPKYNRKKATLPIRYRPTVDSIKAFQVDDDYVPDETLFEKLPEWLRNFRTNLDTIGFKYTLDDLDPIKGSALVIDKSMASTNFFKYIHHIKDYKGTIICCDRALAQVIKHRLPNIVCQLDSSYLCQYFFDLPEVKAVMNRITCVFATTTHPLTARLWHGKKVWFTPWLGNDRVTFNLAAKSNTMLMNAGGEVSTFCWLLARYLQADPIGLFGVYNAIDNIKETEYPDVPHKKIKNKYGTFWCDPVYEFYAKIHKAYIELAKKHFGTTTINTSMGGSMYSKDIKDMPLEAFVRRYS